MSKIFKWSGLVIGGLAMLVLAALAYVYAASEIMLTRTFAITPSHITAARDPDAIARGAHLLQIYGCAGCHGKSLRGGLFDEIPGMVLWSANLPLLAQSYSDADFDRGIRQGLRNDATSLVLMPSNAYASMPDEELAAIIGYIRSQPTGGQAHPAPRLGPVGRGIMVWGLFGTARDELAKAKEPLDLGVEHEAGRRLARLACSECHGGDLTGAPAVGPLPTRPDLALVASYDKGDFVKLMRTGKAAGDRELIMMSDIARARFSHFTDAEIDALYGYLAARGNAIHR